jgi:cytochrome c-type biogenesis protein CcmE
MYKRQNRINTWMIVWFIVLGVVIKLMLFNKKSEVEFIQGGDIQKAIETNQ